jgi:predicted ribosomally synthesized peptide with nif11-like leader
MLPTSFEGAAVMSKQSLNAFRTKLAADENLRNEMTRVLSQDGKKNSASVDEMVAFARSHGFDLTPQDVQQTMELDDNELDSVAGGIIGETGLQLQSSSLNFSISSYSFNFVKI